MSVQTLPGYTPIPGYDGDYLINSKGTVKNKFGRTLAIYSTSAGAAIELRHLGQREKVLIQALLHQAFGGDTNDENL